MGMAGSVGLGGAGGVFDDGASVIGQPTELSIGVEEMRDALLFYADKDAQSIASDRDMKRTMGRMPPEIAAMMGGGMPVNLGQFTMVSSVRRVLVHGGVVSQLLIVE